MPQCVRPLAARGRSCSTSTGEFHRNISSAINREISLVLAGMTSCVCVRQCCQNLQWEKKRKTKKNENSVKRKLFFEYFGAEHPVGERGRLMGHTRGSTRGEGGSTYESRRQSVGERLMDLRPGRGPRCSWCQISYLHWLTRVVSYFIWGQSRVKRIANVWCEISVWGIFVTFLLV